MNESKAYVSRNWAMEVPVVKYLLLPIEQIINSFNISTT